MIQNVMSVSPRFFCIQPGYKFYK